MADVTILDELKAIFDGFTVATADVSVTFTWTEWEEQEEARGNPVTADSSQELFVSDIGGGAQMAEEFVTLRFAYGNAGRSVEWSAWRQAFFAAVLAAIRGNEKGFGGGYFVEVQRIEGDSRLIPTGDDGPVIKANVWDFSIVALRHDVYP